MNWWSEYGNAITMGISLLAWCLLTYFQSRATRIWYRRFRDEQEHHMQTMEILKKLRKIPDDAIGFVFPSKTPDGKPTISFFGKDIQYDNSVWLSSDHPLIKGSQNAKAD